MEEKNDFVSSEDVARCDRNVKRFLLSIIVGYIVFYGSIIGLSFLFAS